MRNLEWNLDDALAARFDEVQELNDLPLQRLMQFANGNRDDL